MLSIIAASSSPQHAGLLYRWFDVQWFEEELAGSKVPEDGKTQFDRPGTWIAEAHVPDTLLAMDDDRLVGGLAFCRYPKPGSTIPAVWINGLLVQPQYRRRGIGTRLVVQAQAAAAHMNKPEIFVYSNLPHLYENLGWQVINSDDEATVLKKVLGVA